MSASLWLGGLPAPWTSVPGSRPAMTRLRRSAGMELALGSVVTAPTAILIATPAPNDAR